jgi:hypothetical protein
VSLIEQAFHFFYEDQLQLVYDEDWGKGAY